MKAMIAAASLAVALVAPTPATAQNCRPDLSKLDSISREKIEVWAQDLYTTSFGAAVVGTSETSVVGTVGRYGTVNVVTIQLQHKEESAEKAAFDARMRGAKGLPILFGFASGEPVKLVVTEVTNAARVQQGLFAAKGVTTVILSAAVEDHELLRLKDALTTRPITAVRIMLGGDQMIEKRVNDKNGSRMMAKFGCFYQAYGAAIATASAAPVAVPPSGIAGRYQRERRPKDYLELSPAGSFVLEQDDATFKGRYRVEGDKLTLMFSGRSLPAGKILGATLVDPEGERWTRTGQDKPTASALTIDQISKMAKAGIPDDVIVKMIEETSSRFSLSPDEVIKLRADGASDTVLRALTRK